MLRSILAASVFGVAVAAAQTPTYTIALKTNPDVGKTVAVEKKADDSGMVKTFGPDGKLLEERPGKSEHAVYRITVLSRGAKDSWKTAAVHNKALEGEPGKAKPLPWQGRTLIAERKQGVTKFGAVGTPPLHAGDLRELLERANRKDKLTDEEEDQIMLPSKPVMVGEEWVIDSKAFARQLPMLTVDHAASKAIGKLVKVYKRGASQFGVLEIRIKLAATGLDDNTVKFKEPLVTDSTLTIDTAIDGSSTERREDYSDTIKGRGQASNGKVTATIEFDGATVGWKTRSAEIDDAKAVIDPKVTMVSPDDWMPYASKDGKYTALFPGKPEVRSETDDNENTTVTASFAADKGNVHYYAAYVDYANAKKPFEPKTMYDALKEKFKDGLTESKSIEVDGRAGVQLVRTMVNDKQKFTMHYRAFAFGTRLYQVMAIVADGAAGEPKKFLESFRFVEKKKD